MLRNKPKWRADRGACALKTTSEIEASIVVLAAEDLLDLHDMFMESAESPRKKLALDEMSRRNLSA